MPLERMPAFGKLDWSRVGGPLGNLILLPSGHSTAALNRLASLVEVVKGQTPPPAAFVPQGFSAAIRVVGNHTV
jgi:hypothetical protein